VNELTKLRNDYIEIRLEEAKLLQKFIDEFLKSYADKHDILMVNREKDCSKYLSDNWIYLKGNYEKNEHYEFIVSFQVIDQDLNSDNIHILDNRIGLMVRKSEKNGQDFIYGLDEWLKAPTMYELPLNVIDREAIAKLIVSGKHRVDQEADYLENSQSKFNEIKKDYLDERNKKFSELRINLINEINKSKDVEGTVGRISFGYHGYKGGAQYKCKYGLELRPYNLGSWRYFEGTVKYKDEHWSFIVTLNLIDSILNGKNVCGDTEKIGMMVHKGNEKKYKYTLADWKKAFTKLSLDDEECETELLRAMIGIIDEIIMV